MTFTSTSLGPFLLALLSSSALAACFSDPDVYSPTSATESASTSGTSSSGGAPSTSGATSTPDPTDTDTASTTGDSTSTTDGEGVTTEPSTSSSSGVCGDGVLDPGEECDNGPENADGALCSSGCIAASCGDDVAQPEAGEECDDGPDNDEAGACTEACKAAKCGDDLIWEGEEECDNGPNNKIGGYGDCTPLECTWWGPYCGDGVLQPEHEECDLGEKDNEADGNACTGSCMLDGKVIFVTSKAYKGALGGLAGADEECNTLALAAGVANAGNFMAWLSTSDASPESRMTHSPGRYVLLDGETIIANSWDDLTDGTLGGGIDIDEAGDAADEGDVWTGTTVAGLAAAEDCQGWTSDGLQHGGVHGSVGHSDTTWSEKAVIGCHYLAHLICVEQ